MGNFDEHNWGISASGVNCARAFTFPALDKGYFHLAAARLSIHCSDSTWAIVIEIFSSNLRAGGPMLAVDTFSTALRNRKPPTAYVTAAAQQNYLRHNPFNEARFFEPIGFGGWIDGENPDLVSLINKTALIRGVPAGVRNSGEIAALGMETAENRIAIHQACRFWAHHHRSAVLATDAERLMSVQVDMKQVLLLEDWHHPDVVGGQVPSETESFRQLARVALSGDAGEYEPTEPPNTHWSNWPDGGSL